MTPEQMQGHLRALARNIGVTPAHREATEEEISHAREWMRLRGNAYMETTEHTQARQSKP